MPHPNFASLVQLNTNLMDRMLDGISDDHAFTRPDGKANSAHFILGHLTASRYSMAGLLGIKEEPSWRELFSRGAEIKDTSAYPSFAELKNAWREISEKLQDRLSRIKDEELAAPSDSEYPGVDKTVGGSLVFLHFHESYHLGQLGYLRRLLGLEGAIG
ncbi:MAG: DinB family protein [Candidatus Zixiibacteriota bacterium]|nr:MAG: DinB family protein [candidate division Zixibacteria bacterium]